MNRTIQLLVLMMITLTFQSCEERNDLGVQFPYQEEQIFSEIIGFASLGFIGSVNVVAAINEPQTTSILSQIRIWEDDKLIWNQFVDTEFFIPYPVSLSKSYRLEIVYNEQTIKSFANSKHLPTIEMENFNVSNKYIDTLGFNVVHVNFDIAGIEHTDSLYYVSNFNLTSNWGQGFQFGEFLKPKSLPTNKTAYIDHLIANINQKHIFTTNLLIIDQSFYQYLKNIVQLGTIPNDNIDGHHGNMEGGIGYFGVVNYDSRKLEI